MSESKGCTYAEIHPPPTYIFGTVANQNAANSVYLAMSTINGTQLANNTPIVKKFKTDWERMQYLAGSFARNTNCSRS